MARSEAETAAASPVNPAVISERLNHSSGGVFFSSSSSSCDLGQFCDPGRIVTRRAVFIDGPNLLPAQEAVRARPGIMNREPTRGLFKIVAIFFFDR